MRTILRRSTRSTIHYHGRTADLDRSLVTLSINGVRWEYTMSAQQCDTVEYLAHKVSVGKALAFAKSHASAATRSSGDPIIAILLRHRGGMASRAKRIKPGMPNV